MTNGQKSKWTLGYSVTLSMLVTRCLVCCEFVLIPALERTIWLLS
jgi:hypothetical protein